MTTGGSTHVRYGHTHRPALLHVCCPACGGRALARKRSEEEMGEWIIDLAGTMELRDWTVRCGACGYQKDGIGFESLPPLFYRASAGGVEVWGWNYEHAQMVLMVLDGRTVEHHSYRWFRTYLRGEWMRRGARARLAAALRTRLAA